MIINGVRTLQYEVEFDLSAKALDIDRLKREAENCLARMVVRDVRKILEFEGTEDVDRGKLRIRGRFHFVEPDPEYSFEKAVCDPIRKSRYIQYPGQKEILALTMYDLIEGNPGAMQFIMLAFDIDARKAERAFRRMRDGRITGSKLYMLWNDCCGRDTKLALRIAHEAPIDKIVKHINYEGGRGFPFTEEELDALC